jgi:hypothetical protein
MKSSREINLEKLQSAHRQELEEISEELCTLTSRVEQIGGEYEGRIHTRLDKARCAMDDAIEALELLEVKGRQGRLI